MCDSIVYCGDCGCRVMHPTVGVWLDNGSHAVRAGDVYTCPTCGKDVVIGAKEPVTRYDNEQLVQRVKRALATTGAPYVSHQYVVESH